MKKYWMLKDKSAVESHAGHVDISAIAKEISEGAFQTYIKQLPDPEPPELTDIDKLVKYAKMERWI